MECGGSCIVQLLWGEVDPALSYCYECVVDPALSTCCGGEVDPALFNPEEKVDLIPFTLSTITTTKLNTFFFM